MLALLQVCCSLQGTLWQPCVQSSLQRRAVFHANCWPVLHVSSWNVRDRLACDDWQLVPERHERPDEETVRSVSIGLVGLCGLNKGQICRTRALHAGQLGQYFFAFPATWPFHLELEISDIGGQNCEKIANTSLPRPFWRDFMLHKKF